MKLIGNWIRWLVTAFILGIAWRHVHWSVALTITLLSIVNELQWSSISRKKDKDFFYRPTFHGDFEKVEKHK